MNPKAVEVKIIGDKVQLDFIGEPIKPVKKALKNNGFKNRAGTYTAQITPNNRMFVKLLTGKEI